MTTETLRHYDRIGLCHPSKVDDWTGYRYYSAQDIVRLNTIALLKNMDLSLDEIKKILEINDFNQIVSFLNDAEKNVDQKISKLKEIKEQLHRAKAFYEAKLTNNEAKEGVFLQKLPSRVIMIAPNLTKPTMSNLWDYHRHFYSQIDVNDRNRFTFEDLAGLIEKEGKTAMFALCSKYKNHQNLRALPVGDYLCANCTEEELPSTLNKLNSIAKNTYRISPTFNIQIIVLTGILKWSYQLQVLISKEPKPLLGK